MVQNNVTNTALTGLERAHRTCALMPGAAVAKDAGHLDEMITTPCPSARKRKKTPADQASGAGMALKTIDVFICLIKRSSTMHDPLYTGGHFKCLVTYQSKMNPEVKGTITIENCTFDVLGWAALTKDRVELVFPQPSAISIKVKVTSPWGSRDSSFEEDWMSSTWYHELYF
jgi:hypothetical protein